MKNYNTSRKRKVLYLFLALCLFFWPGQKALVYALSHWAASSLEKQYACKCAFSKAYFSKGSFCMENVEIEDLKLAYAVKIKRLSLQPKKSLTKLLVHCEEPYVHIKEKEALLRIVSSKKKKKKLFSLEIESLQGKIALKEKKASFSLTHTDASQWDLQIEDSHIGLQTRREKEDLFLAMHLSKVHVEDFGEIFPSSFKGTVSGDADLFFVKGALEKVSFRMEGEDLSGENWQAKKIELEAEYPFDVFFPKKLRLAFEGGAFQKGEHKFTSLQGWIRSQEEIGLKAHMTGSLERGGKIHPFLSEVKGLPSQWIDAKLFLLEENAKKEILFASLQGEHLTCHAQKIPSEIGSFFLSFFPIFWEKGELSFSTHLQLRKQKIIGIESISIEGKEISFYLPHQKLRVETSLASVEGSSLQHLKESTISLQVEEGNICLENGEGGKSVAEHLFCKANYVEGKFLPSHLQSVWNGRKNEWSLSGLWEDFLLSFQCEGDLHQIEPFVQRKEFVAEMAEGAIACKKREGKWEALGNVQISQGEKLLDELQFSLAAKEGFSLQGLEGWLEGKKITLDRVPLFFREERPELIGWADLFVTLEKERLSASLEMTDCAYTSSSFVCSMPKGSACFSFDLKKETGDLFFPFSEVEVSLPHFSSVFSHVQGEVTAKGKEIKIHIGSAESEGLRLGGEVGFNFTHGREVTLLTDFLEGTIASGRKFFSHFSQNFFLSLPLEGKLSSPKNGFFFCASSGKNPFWGLKLDLQEASIPIALNTSIQDFHGTLTWDSEEKSCVLSDVKADLSMHGNQIYPLFIPVFEMRGEDHWSFDVRAQQGFLDLFRLKGAFDVKDMGKDALLTFSFDPCSECFGSKLSFPQLQMKNGSQIEKIEVSSIFPLSSILSLSHFFLGVSLPIEKGEMEGDVHFACRYGCGGDSFIRCEGENLSFCKHEISQFDFFARILSQTLMVEKCRLDDFSASFTVEGKQGKCKVSQMQGKYKDALSLSADLQYLGEGKCDFRFKSLEADTGKILPDFPWKGELLGEGCLSLDFQGAKPKWEADFDMTLKNLSFREMNIENQGKLHIFHSSELGLMVKGINMQIFQEGKGLFSSPCKIGTFYEQSQKWVLEDIAIHVPKDIRNFLSSSLQTEILSLIPSEIPHDIELRGDVEVEKDFSSFHIALPELNVPGSAYPLHHVTIDRDRLGTLITCHYLGYQAALTFHTFPKPFGEITLLDEEEKEHPLTAFWSWEKGGIKLEEIKGKFCGIDACFYGHTETSLSGNVKIDFSKLRALFPHPVDHFLTKYRLGKGYELRGRIGWDPELAKSYFKGTLSGKSFELAGCRFKTLFARLEGSLEGVKIHDLMISDKAGALKIPSFTLKKSDEGLWEFSLPSLKIREFRPSLVHRIGEPKKEIDPFVIRKLVFSDVKGDLHDPKSFSGMGFLTFVNSFKREHTVFDIPSDVIGRIFGLDLELLIPVKGRLEYQMKGGKILFTELKNSYSENKRSKFFLLDAKNPSYMDFDGNLSLAIQMKQYVLFTFTRHFILSVEGNLAHPTYQLKRKKSFFLP